MQKRTSEEPLSSLTKRTNLLAALTYLLKTTTCSTRTDSQHKQRCFRPASFK